MSDRPGDVIASPQAGADERYDAEAELTKGALGRTLFPSAEVMPVIDWIQESMERQALVKAHRVVVPMRGKRGMQSVAVDDFQIHVQGEYWERPHTLDGTALRQMVERTPLLNAIVMTRQKHVARFTRPQEISEGEGFTLRHIDRDHKLTDGEKAAIRELHRFFANSGWEWNPWERKRLRRDSFPVFMAKLVRDTLTMDAAAIEIEPKRDKSIGVDGMYAIDGGTIRLCTEQGYEGDDEICAVQVIQGQIRTAYRYGTLIYEPRNPRTDVDSCGYGLSETELLIRVVSGFLFALEYNIAGFDRNSIPKGVLHLSGNYGKEDLAAFKRYWGAMVRGVDNAWDLPVMVSSDQESKASFERFGVEFNEMYFSKWMTFLGSIACAIYGMSPDEINLESFSAARSSLSGSDTAEKLANSNDKGLRPLLTYFEDIFSQYVLADFSDRFVFRWTGLDEADEDKLFEMRKLVLTVDEARADIGLDASDNGIGDAPLNPNLMGAWMQGKQGSGDFGDPDEGKGEQGPDQSDTDKANSRLNRGAALDDEEGEENESDKDDSINKAVRIYAV